jgi:predicted RNase H-like HicB family nuclease
MNKNTMATKSGIPALVWKEDDLFVAKTVEYDIASQGKTKREALTNLEEAVELYFEAESISIPTPKSVELHLISPKLTYA